MSKNVAVFVDVANIFYAAKAAGVDIDYVTLLKAAVAGRDFVRAYAYTGLDPENENQRQFHAFLARNGYKVVSKDIRKYGDGKVKANLDIELVVDMMRTARNLDVAVVVSGDGDFAPAIRAVQDMGVRCEVISFRGNTSSDLIEVADVFTDITQIARVERGSSRSGRRVAAEEDLSMTEVPDKETEGAGRHRRGRHGEGRDGREGRESRDRRDLRDGRRAAAVPRDVASASAQSLLVLPGEKLRRAVETPATPVEALEAPGEEEEELATGEASEAQGEQGEQGERRRRRRRGGRGRGRGRGLETPQEAVGEEPLEELEDLELEPPRVPQHSTFGSVWDSQLGMPTAPSTPPGEPLEELLDEEEPEIPEYLLAERRQRGGRGRGGRGRGGGGGRNAAYQQAIERERFGRSTPGVPSLGAPRTQRDRQGGGRGPRQPSFERPERTERPRPQREPQAERRVPASDEPWSEVPPEIEEMLRAELAKRGSGQQAPQAPAREAAVRGGAPGRGRGRGRGAAGPAAEAHAEAAAAAAPAEDATALATEATRLAAEAAAESAGRVPAPAGRARGGRRAAQPAPAEAADVAPTGVAAEGAAEAAATGQAPRRRGRVAPATEAPAAAEAVTAAPARRRRAVATPAATPTATEATAEPAAEPAAPARRRRSPAKPPETADAPATGAPDAEAPATPRRRTVRRTKASDGADGTGSGSPSDAG